MSRLAKKPITIPQGVNAEIAGNKITIKGPKGTLDFTHHNEVKVNITPDGIVILKKGNSKKAPAIWGTTARIIEN
ncbi:MAG: 50S ribosomal protein L6, partial [Candidatus Moranbacteria bacterium]|nr:50S ribosomal protein L6 [Candidatus Moranbacteria bacterium]